MLVTWMAYMHIFFLFPVIFYILIVNNTNKNYGIKVKRIISLACIIVLITHLISASWLQPGTMFISFQNNILNVFLSISTTFKFIFSILILLSIIFYYYLLN